MLFLVIVVIFKEVFYILLYVDGVVGFVEMVLFVILVCIMCGCLLLYECFGNIDRMDEIGSSFIKFFVIDIDLSMVNF